MHRAQITLLTGVLATTAILSGCQTATVATAAPPQADASAAPILQKVTMRYDVSNGAGVVMSVVPDFHFVAPGGNAVVLRKELVDTNGPFSQTQLNGAAAINVAPDVQKKGAVMSGGWRCGVAQYYVTLRAYVITSDGTRSNSLEYTIHCNGG